MKRDYSLKSQLRFELKKNPGNWTNRILIGVPTTGLVRIEWVQAKYGQVIPTNWSQVEMTQWLHTYSPLQYQLPDAENLIARQVVEGNYEWFISLEQDNLIPPDTFVRLNEYMIKGDIPIVSGLYFTKSHPSEPILYRGRGNGSFRDFKLGDKVWCDGVPLGFTLIHGSIIRALWDESEEYSVGGDITRRVFTLPNINESNYGFENRDVQHPNRVAYTRGTTDLNFCKRLMKDGIFTKAGWPRYQKMKYPLLVDTGIFVKHIDEQGRQYPLGGIPLQYAPKKGSRPRTIR